MGKITDFWRRLAYEGKRLLAKPIERGGVFKNPAFLTLLQDGGDVEPDSHAKWRQGQRREEDGEN
jgi:hypothetical protein